MQFVSACWLLMFVLVWYRGERKSIVLGLSFEQCQPDDSLFKQANIELAVNTNATGWIQRLQVNSPQQCANRCHHMRPRCKSVTIDKSNTCLIFDINRYSVKAKFRTNASFDYFERYECPQQVTPTDSFGVSNNIPDHHDIRYKRFIAVQKRAMSCKDLYFRFNFRADGLYAVSVDGSDGYLRPIQCNMTTQNGGWTVVERRMNGDVSFEADWNEFKSGFGNFYGDYYYGNENWHLLTKEAIKHELYFILETASGAVSELSYDDVTIGPETDQYRLALGIYQFVSGVELVEGTDKFKSRNDGRAFVTHDRDTTTDQCTNILTGGFWFGDQCGNVNLHGLWGIDTLQGIKWKEITGVRGSDSFRKVTILVR